ncbi:type VII secretion target [Aldersonia sp. NBC_00410]|uniref:type VII secretion target n=1 Tax=Aldersonia sp. NBC_00410 TaxID=2975954 RepID=UPI00224CF59B|nr:type VII secretion target [Aldersonia sp. NBC_00410]MCX5045296.1 type VII secretion target [Aldersonia sp. NBC_00410]
MSSIEVVPAGIRAFADTSAAVSTQLASAGGFDLAENLAAATPVFGLIGADFLAMFALAQAKHATAVGDLSSAYGTSSATAHATATSYERSDDRHTASLGGVASGMGELA